MFRYLMPKPHNSLLLPSSSKPYILKHSFTRRAFTSTPPSLNNTAQPTTKTPSPHTAIYKNFGRAFAKVFLGGVLTYQIIYWAWLRLEVDEEKVERNKEIVELESKARELFAKSNG
ncbi:hypothetical protein PAAG_04671 [Paracoccidioides lutzii Pb01]|uniref:Inner membrane assembly complex subunit 17 n=1 Tax=Paracoccidioides lutzii (strain ATCC MYA-826 / Pb01) TaxID=502779 RepID=C1H241_PARBA|nr:hypothetical protein PAAG_04671 [Paracoccidioides lutzii Pb01]EEH33621.1 hypothetical protein PAAG_04671 [Paracoccidioides lutzii Pb01]